MAAAADAWRAARGAAWRADVDAATGYASGLYGGSAPAPFAPADDADYAQLAALAVEATQALHGVELATLALERTTYLPLGLIGSSDKVAVRFRQEVAGVPVEGGALNVLLGADGRLLALQSTALPDAAGLATRPALDAARALERAAEVFADQVGVAGRASAAPRRALRRHATGAKSREARLAWACDLRWELPGALPEVRRVWIDARDGATLACESLVHQLDVSGTLLANASPGLLPDEFANPEQPLPVPYAEVDGGAAGVAITDADGRFVFPGASGPLSVVARFRGPFSDVYNDAGSEHVLAASISGADNVLTMNPSAFSSITAQANAQRHIGRLRDWIRAVNPADDTADFVATASCNIALACNAFYDGTQVGFYHAGGACPNTSYSTIVVHEMGHWLNDRYGTGNGADGMGEGNADVFALYLNDTPLLGANFYGTGSGSLRTGLNTRPFCGDTNPGCHGEVHVDGEPWMGAAWKIVEELSAAYGASEADRISDALFLGWMNAFDQQGLRSIIETQWLTLDDDDGNVDNGTPHWAQLDTGFRRQGFPGFDVAPLTVTNVTELADTLDELGPYEVGADVASVLGANVAWAELRYRASGDAGWSSTPMTWRGGARWSGELPGTPSPAALRYYVEAGDDQGRTATWPKDAPADARVFRVGALVPFWTDDFEVDRGWTHASFGDTANGSDDWQRGAPQGLAGDPSAAASGTQVWGNDLGVGGMNGAYQPNVHLWLRSPAIDCSGAVGVTLRYARWLTVEEGLFDQARIAVDGHEVWTNPANGATLDDAWATHEVDLSSWADGDASVVLEFSLRADGDDEFGGWTLDDVELWRVAPVSTVCAPPTTYGTAKTNSLGLTADIGALGVPSAVTGNFRITLAQGTPGQPAMLFSGPSSAELPLFNGTRLVGGPLAREAQVVLDGAGAASLAYPIAPGAAGSTRYFQFWYRDPQHPDGTAVGLSDGLAVTWCP
ncbi:MAG: hypothetical protein H6828_09050 [Planctomycetes bacterium]|nr:hypothetical protein [Planctomycetota bacterium]